MTGVRINRKFRWLLLAACAGLVPVAAAVASLGAGGNNAKTASYHEPATLEPIKGTDVQRVLFSAEGAKQVGLQTATISENGQQKVMPYAAVLYDSEGKAFTYTSPEPLTFVRKGIKIERVDGDRVVLSEGPPTGTRVVTTGAAEVYGTEFEVEGE